MSPSAFVVAQIAVCVVAAVLGAAALVRAARRAGSAGIESVIRAGLVAGIATAVALVVLRVAGLGHFGVLRIVYLLLVVTLPAIALGLLGAASLRRVPLTRGAALVALLALIAAPVGAWATFVEPYRLRLETPTFAVPPERAGRGPVRIGILADLQCDAVGDHERAAVDLLLAQRPDAILIPGDIIQATREDFAAARPALRDLLARLDAPAGVWFVVGDVDGPDTIDLLRGTKVRTLFDKVVRFRVGDRDVTLGGISSPVRGASAERVLDELERTAGDGDVRILMAHRPDWAFELAPDSRIDLLVAGHTHGGQVVVPGFGPPMTLSGVPRGIAAGGLHRMDGNAIYVSRGVGMERLQAPRMRFLCPPEVTLLTIESASRETSAASR